MLVVLQAGKCEQAVGVFGTALALRIKDVKVRSILHSNRGVAYNMLGQHITAIAECHLAEAACPTVWEPYVTRAGALTKLGLHSEALQVHFHRHVWHPDCCSQYHSAHTATLVLTILLLSQRPQEHADQE